MNNKATLSKYWVQTINSLLDRLKMDNIDPDTFSTLLVQDTDGIFNLTVICTDKMLVLHSEDGTSKITGGWKEF